MDWYLKVLKQYADFSGRARRKEYWMFLLFSMFFTTSLLILDHEFGLTIQGRRYGLLSGIYGLVMLIPTIAVSVRRLHDVGKSGWTLLNHTVGIPFIGAIWLLVLFCTNSQQGNNKWGENPKEATV